MRDTGLGTVYPREGTDLWPIFRGDADLRVRLHAVRVALRGARPRGRPAGLPRLRRSRRPEAVLGVRHARRGRPTELRTDGSGRRMLRRLVRLRALAVL